MEAVRSYVRGRKHHVSGQLALNAKVPNLGLILLEVLGDEEHAESGRRGKRCSRRIWNIYRRDQPIAAQAPEWREQRRCGELSNGEQRIVSFQSSAGRAEIIGEVADPERCANRSFSLVGRIRQADSRP